MWSAVDKVQGALAVDSIAGCILAGVVGRYGMGILGPCSVASSSFKHSELFLYKVLPVTCVLVHGLFVS